MRRVVAGIGRTFITVGILILLFVAYQLWGTGIYTAREQDQLEQQFDAGAATTEGQDTPAIHDLHQPTGTTVTTPPTTTTTSPHRRRRPKADAVAQIVIPKIGVD